MKRDSGFALVHAMLLVLVVMIAAGAMLSRSRSVVQQTLSDRAELHALYAAEGGLAKARHALRRDGGFAGGRFTVGRATATVTVRRTADDQWEIESRGVQMEVDTPSQNESDPDKRLSREDTGRKEHPSELAP